VKKSALLKISELRTSWVNTNLVNEFFRLLSHTTSRLAMTGTLRANQRPRSSTLIPPYLLGDLFHSDPRPSRTPRDASGTMATSMATSRGLGCVSTFAGSSCVRRPAAARRAGTVARRAEARSGIASPLVGTGVRARRRGRPSVAPVAALGSDAADALASLAPHAAAAATLAAARVG